MNFIFEGWCLALATLCCSLHAVLVMLLFICLNGVSDVCNTYLNPICIDLGFKICVNLYVMIAYKLRVQ